MKIKKIARELGIEEVTLTESGKLILTFGESVSVSPQKLVNIVKENSAFFTPERKLYLEASTLNDVIFILENLKDIEEEA
jgi:transcription-repair coupling factor (superfamily II helicase)